MRRSVACAALLLLVLASPIIAQDSADKPGPSITFYASGGFPTGLGVGIYYPLPFFAPDTGLLQGVEASVSFGLGLDQPQLFAAKNQKGLVEETVGGLRNYKWYHLPEGGLDSGGTTVLGIRTYLNAYELDLPFARMPLSAGLYMGFGSSSAQKDHYGYFDFMLTAKAEARLHAFKLLTPYIELGIGGGSTFMINKAAKTKLAGGDYSMNADYESVEYGKYNNGQFSYLPLLLNVGVRFDLSMDLFSGKKSAAKAAAEAEAKAAAPAKDTRVGKFLFPKWLMDMGGLAYHPEPLNPMAGSVMLGPQVFFGKYSFKYQSSVKGNAFNHTFADTDIIEILQSDDSIYKATLRTKDGQEMLFELVPFKKGDIINVGGKDIEADAAGVLYGDQLFTTIRASNM
jgi:hypothetical protein